MDERISDEEYQDRVWDIIDNYFSSNRDLPAQTITTFNRFLTQTLPGIIVKCGRVTVNQRLSETETILHLVEFTSAYLERHIIQHSVDGRVYPLYPHEARLRNLTYSSPLSVDIRHSIKKVDGAGCETLLKKSMHTKIPIGDVPIMVKSEFCRLHGLSKEQLAAYNEDPDDPGGYFIVGGKEKVIVVQDLPAKNKVLIFKSMCGSKNQLECEIVSTVDEKTERVSQLRIQIPGDPKSYGTFKDFQPRSGADINKRKANKAKTFRKKLLSQYAKSRPRLVVSIDSVKEPIPLLILFKAMGFERDEEIWETFLVESKDNDFYEAMQATMENNEAKKTKSEKDALLYIGGKSKKVPAGASPEEVVAHGQDIICEDVLPELGNEVICQTIKGYHIGYMVNKLINAYLGRIPCDDRDHLENKRYDLAGPMLATLFKDQIKSLMYEARLAIKRRLDLGVGFDIKKNIFRQKHITRGVIYAMKTGSWGDKRRGSLFRSGVTQDLNRLTGVATLSFRRRVNSQVNRLVRMTAPRQLHTTAFGFICPSDTPEGETVGLTKALSLMTEISMDCDKGPIVDVLETMGYNSIEDHPEKLLTDTKIIIDSEIMGSCPQKNASAIMERLKQCRRDYNEELEIQRERRNRPLYKGFSSHVSLHYDYEVREIRIRTDSGRATRPLLVVKNNELVLRRGHLKRLLDPRDSYGWSNLVRDGVIEYLDAAESESAMIAMFPGDLKGATRSYFSKCHHRPIQYKVSYTHCEIHPSMILGVCAALIPFPNHNQAPRNNHHCGMAKQAVGIYLTNYQYRCDGDAHVLHYPQRPLVTTKAANFIKYNDYPAGINAISAICCYSGYNQEDSVILNRSAIDRGFFRSTYYRTKTEEAKKGRGRGDMDETFELPRRGEVNVFRHYYFAHLDEDGLPAAGIPLENNDVLIGRTQRINNETRNMHPTPTGGRGVPLKKDVSLMFRSSSASGYSYVDTVILTDTSEGYRMVKAKIRTPRTPQIGDKFASRHGQKGVLGMDFRETELPFTKDGIVPDVIINPHAIPSRMTIGHLLETVESKRNALEGRVSDGTPFNNRFTVEDTGERLERKGHHRHGLEVMYDGATGRKMTCQIFIGPVYYQRLKHMTEDKIHIRSRGPITELCRQPSAGLQNEGGLRFGEMERDSTISHGAAAFLRERLFIVSDYHALPVCSSCGTFLTRKPSGSLNDYIMHLKCRFCSNPTSAATVEIPYACKLLFQELMSMNISVRVGIEDDSKFRKLSKDCETKRIDSSENGTTNFVSLIMDKMETLKLKE